MERNKELIERTMQHIVDHPEAHDQRSWISNACGTSACFAGWALMLDGVHAEEVLSWSYQYTGRHHSRVKKEAGERLGLTPTEAFRLFRDKNTRDMLQLMVKDLLNGEELRFTHQYEEDARG
jgi:hypothetical protein